jgi:hypothetical protein
MKPEIEILEAMIELGYGSNWILSGNSVDDIQYLDNALPKPTKNEILEKIKELPQIRETKKQLKISAYKKLGLSEDEINAIIGSV